MGQVNSVGIEMMYCVKYNVTNLHVFSRSTYIFVLLFLYDIFEMQQFSYYGYFLCHARYD